MSDNKELIFSHFKNINNFKEQVESLRKTMNDEEGLSHKTDEMPNFEDKSTWGDGPWQNELDQFAWIDSETGYRCLIRRGASGAFCGYVGINKSHPLFGKDYDDCDFEVHGGLTFSSSGWAEDLKPDSILKLNKNEEEVWWLGFDCAHFGDYSPKTKAITNHVNKLYKFPFPIWEEEMELYRDFDYVKDEVKSLAQQLFDIENGKWIIKN